MLQRYNKISKPGYKFQAGTKPAGPFLRNPFHHVSDKYRAPDHHRGAMNGLIMAPCLKARKMSMVLFMRNTNVFKKEKKYF